VIPAKYLANTRVTWVKLLPAKFFFYLKWVYFYRHLYSMPINCKRIKHINIKCFLWKVEGLVFFSILFCFGGMAQDKLPVNALASEEKWVAKSELYPNIAGKGMMTPTGWGSLGNYAFVYLGGTFPQVYTSHADLVAGVGAGIGNCYKTVSLSGILNINNVSGINTCSASFFLGRHLATGSSMSAGAMHLFADKKSDAGASYFLAFSHAVQTLPSKTAGYARLCYSIGAGTGRFYDKSSSDIVAGKGRKGTAVFANISYAILKNININAEWSGLNFGVAVAWRPLLPIKFPFNLPAICIGLADLTRFSGQRPRLVISVGHAFSLQNKKGV
jgi:hypothetical protein